MQIEIRPGLLVFVKGKGEDRVRELMTSLRSAGYRIMAVSSRQSQVVMDDLKAPIGCVLTLTETVGQYCLDPQNLMVLTDTITKFIERGGPSAFLIEDLGLLKQKNDFPKVLRMVGHLKESLAINRGIGIATIDPQSWEENELAHFGKEGCIVEEKDRLGMKFQQSADH